MKYVCFVVVAACYLASSKAIKCLTCDNARSNKECARRGRVVECRPNEHACHNEIRTDDRGVIIKKRCKESNACTNNFAQNPRAAWKPSQCNFNWKHTVCRCCCYHDECNTGSYFCLGENPDCPPIGIPMYGSRNCQFKDRMHELGSVCNFTCDPGYSMVGSPVSECAKFTKGESRFTHPAPVCIRAGCDPQTNPMNGRVECTDGENRGSVCTFTCNFGFKLLGEISTECTNKNEWSNDPAICVSIRCYPKQEHPDNGLAACTNYNFVGSKCSFKCNEGYRRVGARTRECMDDGDGDREGEWNVPSPTCEVITCDPKQGNPVDGRVLCSDSNFYGSICEYECDVGYRLSDENPVKCGGKGEWDRSPPVCNLDVCNPVQTAPEFGSVLCSDDNRVGSVCDFQCGPGYFLDGSAATTCGQLARWSHPRPVCTRITCPPPMKAPINGAVTCSDSHYDGSECSFTCDGEYALVGSTASVCRDDGNGDEFGLWSEPAPTCKLDVCNPVQTAPDFGSVACSDGNRVGSTCNFECDESYFLDGSASTLCRPNAKWSRPAPKCRPIVCQPRHNSLKNGGVSCSNENFVGSLCTFSCNTGFSMIGDSDRTTCRDDGDGDGLGEWTHPPPACAAITCPPPFVTLRNGDVTCSETNLLGSVCTFTCNEGYVIVEDAETSECQDDGNGDEIGRWSEPAPTCNRVRCPPARKDPDNGAVSCTDGLLSGSVCTYSCDRGHVLTGSPTQTCEDDNNGDFYGVWSNAPPTCEPIRCRPRYEDPRNGAVSCTNSNLFQSVCTFSCSDDYELVGPRRSTCTDDGDGDADGMWDADAPQCTMRSCGEAPAAPENGFRVCTDGNFIGSQCEYGCDAYHRREGPLYSTCRQAPSGLLAFDNPAPVCVPNSCAQPSAITNGRISCSNEYFANSVCTYECDQSNGYSVYPAEHEFRRCQNNSEWDLPKPCCTRLCPPYATMDIAVVMDSSSSVGSMNWDLQSGFVQNLLKRFQLGEAYSRMSAFRYNTDVGHETEIKLNDVTDDMDEFIRRLRNIGWSRGNTMTGYALQHVVDVHFQAENGNRPDVKDIVFVITDGKSDDDVAPASKQLRDNGALVFAVGIYDNFAFDPNNPDDMRASRIEKDDRWAELLKITGETGPRENFKRTWLLEEGFEGLENELVNSLAQSICGEPCSE